MSKNEYFVLEICWRWIQRKHFTSILWIELTEPSDALKYKLFFKHGILQIIAHEILTCNFVIYVCAEQNLLF